MHTCARGCTTGRSGRARWEWRPGGTLGAWVLGMIETIKTDVKPGLGGILERARVLRADLNAERVLVLHDVVPRPDGATRAAAHAEIALAEAIAWLEDVTTGEA